MSRSRVVSSPGVTIDQHDALFVITELVRSGRATTRSELGRISGLGRSIVTQRVEDAIEMGLLEESELGASTGGRMPRTLRFKYEIGCFVIAVFDSPYIRISVTDLAGEPLAHCSIDWDFTETPDHVLKTIVQAFSDLSVQHSFPRVWGSVIGVPGPVEFQTGKLQASMLIGWNGFDIKAFMAQAFTAPCWVDNDVNLIALGEYALLQRQASADDHFQDLLFIEVGLGIGAGLISRGQVHRGANGAAGDIGHIHVPDYNSVLCRCGQMGCLSAVAGGWGLAQEGERAAREGRSPFLKETLESNGVISHMDIAAGVAHSDPYCIEAVSRAGRIVGETLAGLVNFYNPSLVVVGGSIAGIGDIFLASVRQAIYRRALPLATRDLRVIACDPKHEEGTIGGAALAQTETFTRGRMNELIENRL